MSDNTEIKFENGSVTYNYSETTAGLEKSGCNKFGAYIL